MLIVQLLFDRQSTTITVPHYFINIYYSHCIIRSGNINRYIQYIHAWIVRWDIINNRLQGCRHLMTYSQSHHHSCNCKEHLDGDTQAEVEVLEGVESVLHSSYTFMSPPHFQTLFEKSFTSLYNLSEKHWYKAQFYSVRVLTAVMEKWINKFNAYGKQIILYYLSQAMNTCTTSTDESLDYIQKAKMVSEEEIYDAKHLLPKIYVIEGDILSNLEPESALESYQNAIQFCRSNCLFFPNKEKSFDLKESMIESLFKSAMIAKTLEQPSEDILELLEQTKRYAIEVQGHKSFLVNQLEAMCYNQKIRSKQDSNKQEQETLQVGQKNIEIGHGSSTRQLTLKVSYTKNEQRLVITVQDKQNQQMRSKSVPLQLKNPGMLENIKNSIQDWINVDKNLKITIDEKGLERASEGGAIPSKLQEKHKMIKLIKKSEMFKNLFDNTNSEIDKELANKKLENQHQHQNEI